MENFVLPYLEWEILREPVAIYKVADRTELPKGQKRIMINRTRIITSRQHFISKILSLTGIFNDYLMLLVVFLKPLTFKVLILILSTTPLNLV